MGFCYLSPINWCRISAINSSLAMWQEMFWGNSPDPCRLSFNCRWTWSHRYTTDTADASSLHQLDFANYSWVTVNNHHLKFSIMPFDVFFRSFKVGFPLHTLPPTLYCRHFFFEVMWCCKWLKAQARCEEMKAKLEAAEEVACDKEAPFWQGEKG